MGKYTNMNKLIIPFLSIISLFVVACNDDDNKSEPIIPFSLEKNYYETRLERGATSISITNGSGDISLAIEDEDILKAIYSKYNDKEDNRKGHINLYGLQKGATMLTITDNITKDVETVEVKVTDCYLAYVINDSNHPVLPAGTTLFLVNNQAQDYYLFDQDNTYNKPILKDNGYEFFIKLDAGTGTAPTNYAIPNLRLYKHNPADAATTTSEFYDFQIEMYGEDASSSSVLKIIQAYLDVDWEELISNALTKSPAPPIDMTMIMTVPDTDYRIRGILSTVSIPEHILD